ncbi:MAG: single-stranded-DNA-specific exonuclease RecJ [Patescibacteria group bacterium]
MTKKWQLAEPISNQTRNQFPEIEPVLVQLLYNRDITSQKTIDEFLNPDWGEDVHDPYLFKNMQVAVERVYKAINNSEIIGIYADYDADGVTGGVILCTTLQKLGARVEVYIPHREQEGYGLNMAAINYLADKKVKLIVTCDCGVANVDEVQSVKKLGIDIIITDHHQAKSILPPADAIIHPNLEGENYPGKNLSGGAVAFKLVQGLLRNDLCDWTTKDKESWEKWLLDLVAISLVADMVPLIGEARTLTKYGLIVLQKNKRLGLSRLLQTASIKPENISTYTIGWQIAPRINAAGRMDHANAGFALLSTEDAQQADELARSLNLKNSERQKITDEMVKEAIEQIGELKKNDYAVVAYKPDWSLGIVGLVAGKLVQYYNRPAVVMCFNQQMISGSGRSLPAFDLIQALSINSKFLIKYGGHKQAAGFKLAKENFESFVKAFRKVAKKQLESVDLTPVLNIDCVLSLQQIDWKLYEQINKLEPTGQGNGRPIFMAKDLQITNIESMGSEAQHRRLFLTQNNDSKKFIAFNLSTSQPDLKINDIIDVAFEIGVNEWNGNRELQLKIIDIKVYDKKDNSTS